MSSTHRLTVTDEPGDTPRQMYALLRISCVKPGSIILKRRQKYTAGSGHNREIVIRSRFVSGLHFTIDLTDFDTPVISDNASTNGTKVNGRLLTGSCPLTPDTIIEAADYMLLFVKAIQGHDGNIIYSFNGLIGRSTTALKLYRRIAMAAFSRSPVLVRGKSGTGKELIARTVAKLYMRTAGAGTYKAINASNLDSGLLEAELFGATQGAFTGAVRSRRGILEEAGDGVVFLDEIGNLSLSAQQRLLRTVEYGEIRSLGSNKIMRTRCRFIFATNRDLETMVRSGLFQEDFLFRINAIQITAPDLTGNASDLRAVANAILWSRDCRIDEDVLGQLIADDWPGRIRQLIAFLNRLLQLSRNNHVSMREYNLARELCGTHASREDLSRERLCSMEDILRAQGIARSTFYYRLRKQRVSK